MILHKALILWIASILIVCLSVMNLNSQNLTKHQWENRILIIKTSNIHSKTYQTQLREFENSSEELIDRKFVVYQITNDNFKFINFKNSALNSTGEISEKLKNNILKNNKNFEVIVIGLDGGIKLQQNYILTKTELFNIIDSMPMRSNELRINKN